MYRIVHFLVLLEFVNQQQPLCYTFLKQYMHDTIIA